MQDILEKFQKRLQKAKAYRAKWDDDMKKSFGFYGKRQWDEKDKAALMEQERPAVTFNFVRPIINTVSGSEVTNRFEPKFLPRSFDGATTADMLTDTVKFIRDQSNAEQHDSAAFRDAIICGVGCVEFYQDYSENMEGKTVIKRIPISEMYWDPNAYEANLLDAKYIIRERWIDEDEFAAMFGDSEAFGTGESEHNNARVDYTRPWITNKTDEYNAQDNKIKVHEYQWYDEIPRYLVEVSQMSPQGLQTMQKTTLVTDHESTAKEKLAELKQIAEAQGLMVTHATLPHKLYRRAFILGQSTVLELGSPPINAFTYLFITGYQDVQENEFYWQGMVHDMRDPQEWANKFFSQMVHIVATNPKGAMIAPSNAFEDISKAKKDWAKPNVILETNLEDPERQIKVVNGSYPTGTDVLFQHASGIFGQVVGVNMAYFVPTTGDLARTANTAVQSVNRQTMVVLSILFDSLRLYRREQGKLFLHFIKEYMPDDAIVRITDQNGLQSWQPFKQSWVHETEYEVVVEESPTSPSVRHEFWNSLIQTRAIDVLMQSGILTGDIIADLMDVPPAIRERMKQNWAMMMQAQTGQAPQ